MNVKQLIDTRTGWTYTLNVSAMVLEVSSEAAHRQHRLKLHHADMLAALFAHHPEPVSYAHLTSVLLKRHMVCTDDTRLHRKMSALRQTLHHVRPGLGDMITNIRGVGYGLPVSVKEPTPDQRQAGMRFKNKTLQDVVTHLTLYAEASLEMAKQCPFLKREEGWILDRQPVIHDVAASLTRLADDAHKVRRVLLQHPHDVVMLRIEASLALLGTYIGLARISEFAITHAQWAAWHRQETQRVIDQLVHLLAWAEEEAPIPERS
ncbi:helix-turn-helix domain-containing protein [Candidatus Hepatobacter penaei]|uniref:helix-turn-helix domain-containing protein n=1 Tax=Candidatus Hepatobacter penaei TaxID=1274402 RepID=UPI0004F2A33F|nr:helix-turn-helix domain-containing protein [Candidatus Hepatobacter penaei]